MFWQWVSNHSKHIVYVTYGILMIYGIGLLVWGLEDSKSGKTTVLIWIIVGSLSTLNGALGIYGTAVDDNCLVYASLVFMFLSCVSQILVIVIRISMPETPSEAAKDKLFAIFRTEDEEPFQDIELEHSCCGVVDYRDYEEKFDPFLLGYPPSCCGWKSGFCSKPRVIGCHKATMDALSRLEAARAVMFLGSSCLEFASALVIAILTIWGEDLV